MSVRCGSRPQNGVFGNFEPRTAALGSASATIRPDVSENNDFAGITEDPRKCRESGMTLLLYLDRQRAEAISVSRLNL